MSAPDAPVHVRENEYRDPRADELRARYHALFSGQAIPVPVEAIAEDLLGLSVEEDDDLPVSGMLIPSERRIYLNGREAKESPGRRRFTLAHEVGHWICQCLDGRSEPVMCRAADVGANADRALEREANVFAAELLMPENLVRARFTASGGPDALANDLGASNLAVAWRLYSLDLIDSKPVSD